MKFLEILKQHKFLLCGLVVGLFGGFWGILLGLMVGFFGDRLFERTNNDNAIIKKIADPYKLKEKEKCESFEGCLLVCAIAFNDTGNVQTVTDKLQLYLGKEYPADYGAMCVLAQKAGNTNSDILVECLASKLKKNNDERLLELIFKLFTTLEYGWDDRVANRPSGYLAELLNYTKVVKTEEKDMAYLILGVKPDASVKEIKDAHRKLVRQYHPDTLKGLTEEQKKLAEEAFMRIQKAFEEVMKKKY
jgi:hypothetical protein